MPVLSYANTGAGTTVPGTADVEDLGSVDAEWRRLYLGAQLDAILFGIAQDVGLGRAAADVLALLAGDSLRLAADGGLEFGTDVRLVRGAADRLHLASGDSLAPAVDNNATLGLAAQRYSNIFGAIITGGDFLFENGWKLVEAERMGLREGIALVKPDGTAARVWH
jgi:hypothetical protein